MTRLIALLLSLALLILSVTGCGVKVQAQSLTEGITPNEGVTTLSVDESFKQAHTALSVALLKELHDGNNTLISPASVIQALALTGMGASGETLLEFTSLFSGMSPQQLAYYMPDYRSAIETGGNLKNANSAWYKNVTEAQPSQQFLQDSVDYFGAELFTTPFDDAAVKQVNAWVKEATDGTIDKVVKEFDPTTLIYLVNALSFEADWDRIYKKENVRDADFTNVQGKVSTVDMMYSDESVYLVDENTTGFMKHYEGGNFAFVSLLPNEDVSLDEYIKGLSGEKITGLLENAEHIPVNAGLPIFKTEYSTDLCGALKAMGLTTAFDGKADFSAMSRFNRPDLFIGSITHKTFISVDTKGTKAGAVTSVAMNGKSASPESIKSVILDRPFVYMIIDTKTNLPVFMGTVCEI